MKVTKTPNFSPITVVLETEEELKDFNNILTYASCYHLRHQFYQGGTYPPLLLELKKQIENESGKTF